MSQQAENAIRPRRTGSRSSRLVNVIVALLLSILVGFPAATAALFLWPPTDQPDRVDAVVVLSGDHGERMRRALELMADGVAPILVHAGTPDSVQVLELCAGGQPFEVICPMPDPDSTRAEARAVAGLAESHGWESIAVVTSDFHVTRARLLFGRCFDGVVEMVGPKASFPVSTWLRQLVHEWAAVAHAFVIARGC